MRAATWCSAATRDWTCSRAVRKSIPATWTTSGRGDDSPKLQQLTVFQTRVAAALSAIFTPRSVIPEDTDGDGTVTAVDVLLLINYLNAGPLYTGASAPGGGFPALYDVNRDGRVTPLDVLLVINYLNAAAVAGGEGESASYPEAFVTTPSASLSSAILLSEPIPAAAERRESPLWPAFDSRDDAGTVRGTGRRPSLGCRPARGGAGGLGRRLGRHRRAGFPRLAAAWAMSGHNRDEHRVSKTSSRFRSSRQLSRLVRAHDGRRRR